MLNVEDPFSIFPPRYIVCETFLTFFEFIYSLSVVPETLLTLILNVEHLSSDIIYVAASKSSVHSWMNVHF